MTATKSDAFLSTNIDNYEKLACVVGWGHKLVQLVCSVKAQYIGSNSVRSSVFGILGEVREVRSLAQGLTELLDAAVCNYLIFIFS